MERQQGEWRRVTKIDHFPINSSTMQSTGNDSSGWINVSRSRPCSVCGKTSWCRIGVHLVHCKRIESGRPAKGGGWYHAIDPTSIPPLPVNHRKPSPRKTDEELDQCFRKETEAAHAAAEGGLGFWSLAALLGVSADSLRRLGVGWNGTCWTIPERNPAGMITGVAIRYTDGSKIMLPGSRRGLVYRSDLRRHIGETVLIVEGMSDVAVALTLGLVGVGRPNNSGGGTLLARLLRGWAGTIVVMGENDYREPKPIPNRPHSPDCKGCQRCFPGKYGAEVVTEALRKAIHGTRVVIRFPPLGAKDLRSWMNARKVDPENAAACRNLGQSLLRLIHVTQTQRRPYANATKPPDETQPGHARPARKAEPAPQPQA